MRGARYEDQCQQDRDNEGQQDTRHPHDKDQWHKSQTGQRVQISWQHIHRRWSNEQGNWKQDTEDQQCQLPACSTTQTFWYPNGDGRLCGRENDKYAELFTNFLLLAHGLTAYKRQTEKINKKTWSLTAYWIQKRDIYQLSPFGDNKPS